jgi:transposase
MDTVFPEIFTIFAQSSGKTLLYLLKDYPLPEDIVKAGVDTIQKTLKAYRQRLSTGRLPKVFDAARISIGIRVAPTSYRIAIHDTVERITVLMEKKEHVEDAIDTILPDIPETSCLLSMKGVGPVTAAMVIGETGGLSRYSRAEEVLKLAGLTLYEISSGKHRGKVRITKRGRPLLRYALFIMATIQVRKGMPFYETYQELRKRGMVKMKALTAISRKLCRVLFSLVRDKRFYSDQPPGRSYIKQAA